MCDNRLCARGPGKPTQATRAVPRIAGGRIVIPIGIHACVPSPFYGPVRDLQSSEVWKATGSEPFPTFEAFGSPIYRVDALCRIVLYLKPRGFQTL